MQFKNVRTDITKGISDLGKKLPHIGKVPHDDNEASRDIEKSLAHVSGVLMHVNPPTRVLRNNPFELLFSPPDMHEEKNDVVFPLPDVHRPAILHTFSAFVLKQRASMHRPAGAVNNDDTVQATAVAGREEDMARHPETCDWRMLRRASLTG